MIYHIIPLVLAVLLIVKGDCLIGLTGTSRCTYIKYILCITQDIPVYSCCMITVLFAWLNMATICENGFDQDSKTDVNLEDELDRNIWSASMALQSFETRNA